MSGGGSHVTNNSPFRGGLGVYVRSRPSRTVCDHADNAATAGREIDKAGGDAVSGSPTGLPYQFTGFGSRSPVLLMVWF